MDDHTNDPSGGDQNEGDQHTDREDGPTAGHDPESRAQGHPIDGNALLIAAAKASVGPGRLPELLRDADEYLRSRAEEYDRAYERVDLDDETAVATYLVPDGHWAEVGVELGLNGREVDAIRRAHEQHLLRVGTRRRRRQEFETALDLREAVVVSR